MIPTEKDSHPSEQELEEAWQEGYRLGFDMCEPDNPYEENSLLWLEYATGYNNGYSES